MVWVEEGDCEEQAGGKCELVVECNFVEFVKITPFPVLFNPRWFVELSTTALDTKRTIW